MILKLRCGNILQKNYEHIQSEVFMQLVKLVTYDQVKSKVIEIRNQKVILDSDVAELYNVETKRVNEAVTRNPAKFPDGYLIELTPEDWGKVKSQIATSPKGGGKVKLPTAFTERGLYMLATILKSPQAVGTTIAIIETFAQIKELTQAVYQFAKAETHKQRVKIFGNSTSIAANLLYNELTVSQHEMSFKLPFFHNINLYEWFQDMLDKV